MDYKSIKEELEKQVKRTFKPEKLDDPTHTFGIQYLHLMIMVDSAWSLQEISVSLNKLVSLLEEKIEDAQDEADEEDGEEEEDIEEDGEEEEDIEEDEEEEGDDN